MIRLWFGTRHGDNARYKARPEQGRTSNHLKEDISRLCDGSAWELGLVCVKVIVVTAVVVVVGGSGGILKVSQRSMWERC